MSCLEEEVSEDDLPSTGASEDSVDIQVKPIVCFPRKKIAHENLKERNLTSPLDFSIASLTASHSVNRVLCHSPLAESPTNLQSAQKKCSDADYKLDQRSSGTKRPHNDEWYHRKAMRRNGDDESCPSSSNCSEVQSSSNILRPSPLLSHYVPPHLLLPSTWPHMSRFPYPHLVGSLFGSSLGALGFLPPVPYPVLPAIPPRLPLVIPPHPSPWDTKPVVGEQLNIKEESSQQPRNHRFSPEFQVSSNQGPSTKEVRSKSPRKRNFLSVESLLNTKVEPSETRLKESSINNPLPQLPSKCNLPSTSKTPDLSEGSIHSLLNNSPKQKQRNYKNMTRERRIEANARERTRVHTISAAFETLRQTIPAFSHNQKLSKLSVLRIASSYIFTLSRLADEGYSEGNPSPSLEECVDLTTKTIQVEGKAKKKKED